MLYLHKGEIEMIPSSHQKQNNFTSTDSWLNRHQSWVRWWTTLVGLLLPGSVGIQANKGYWNKDTWHFSRNIFFDINNDNNFPDDSPRYTIGENIYDISHFNCFYHWHPFRHLLIIIENRFISKWYIMSS